MDNYNEEFPWKKLLEAEPHDTGRRPDFQWLLQTALPQENDKDKKASSMPETDTVKEEGNIVSVEELPVENDELEEPEEYIEPETPGVTESVTDEFEESGIDSEEETEEFDDTFYEESLSEEEAAVDETLEEIPQEGNEPYTGEFINISPSQDVMFRHLNLSEKHKKYGIVGVILAILFLLPCATGSIAAVGSLISAIMMAVYSVKQFQTSKEEESFVSDTKRGYLRIEGGILHCEQGVGTQYEEIHIPLVKIKEILTMGNMSTRYLVLGFASDAAKMLVNGIAVNEGIFEIRGGIYEEPGWNMFIKLLQHGLPSGIAIKDEVWEDTKNRTKLLLIIGIVIAVLSLILQILMVLGVVNFVL